MKPPNPFPNYRPIDVGRIDYPAAFSLQKQILNEVIAGHSPHTLILCEHFDTITLGRLADKKNILASEELLARENIPVFPIDRGGDVTYHGPGQLVAYPIFDLHDFGLDLKQYLRNLEKVVIDFLQYFGIKGRGKDGLTGVWVGKNKIASIGIGVKRWVSYHGIAVNLSTDLQKFSLIRPCGLEVAMTSVKEQQGGTVDFSQAAQVMEHSFENIFGLRRKS